MSETKEKHPVWQSLMDNAYDSWRKEQDLSYENFLFGLSQKERCAVLLGNLNYQVGNGGFSQWVDNGYALQGKELLVVLEKMDTSTSLEIHSKVEELLNYVDLNKKNRGCFGDYWKKDSNCWEENEEMDYNEGAEFASSLDDWYYGLNDKFMDEVEEFLKNFSD